jgi:DNA-binding NarL/FixJ family response regulator
MERLQQRDLRATLDFVGGLETRDLDSFRSSVVGGLRRLVPCDVATYDEINADSGEVFWLTDPGEHATIADDDAFVRNIAEHPVIEHHRVTGDGTPRTFSDFYSRKQLHATALYNEFFRPMDIGTQVGMLFYGPTPAIVGLTLNGERTDFSQRDRAVLDILRPHLGRAFENALARTRSDRMLAALEAGADRAGASVVVLSADGRIEAASAGARRRLSDFFGDADAAERLPEDVELWVRAQRRGATRPLTRERGGASLRVRFMRRGAPAEPDALLLEERAPLPTPDSLRGLGLTRRQCEVLALIAAGRSNGEIAEALTISPLTAKKHAENIYARLGAPGRAAAAARAHQAMSNGLA